MNTRDFAAKFVFLASVATLVVGCEAMRPGPRHGYGNPDDDVYGRSSRMEYTQKHRSIVLVLEQMKTDPMFTVQYDNARKRALAAGRTFPTIAVRPIENNTGDGRSDAAVTGQMYRELITQIRKTGLFEMIDYARRHQMKKTVVAAVDDGEAPANLEHIGNYTSADFIMTGELRRERTDEPGRTAYHHFLNLEMTDTSTGTVFWSDTATPTFKNQLR